MAEFRYAQFCALARAAELLGERWTLLILRDLFVGPQRFSALRRSLRGVSPSVLSERLAQLERRGLIRRRALPPPAACAVYELDQNGRALEPALRELARWGARFLLPAQPGDYLEPSSAVAALAAFVRRAPSPPGTVELRIPDGPREHVLFVRGGRRGTRLSRQPGPSDLVVSASVLPLLRVLTGLQRPAEALASGELRASGDLTRLDTLPELFEFDFGENSLGFPATTG